MFEYSAGAETDAVINANVHHNGGYQILEGDAKASFPTSGRGYPILPETVTTVIGLGDVDQTDPEFVEPTRSPLTWDISLGGTGTLAEVIARLKPGGGSTVLEMRTWIYDGWVPQNTAFQGTGDGGEDIGAMDVVPLPTGPHPGNNGRMMI